MDVLADPEHIVVALGGMFPHTASWLEEAAEVTAKKLKFGNRNQTWPTFFFDEDHLLVGKTGFEDHSEDGRKVIEYSRELPIYSPDGNNDDGPADIMDLAKTASSLDGRTIGILSDYLESGPYIESFAVRNYEDPSVLRTRSRFDYNRRLVLKGRDIQENLTLRIGVDQESLYDFVKHLHKIAEQNPEALFFETELMKRKKEPLKKEVASVELNEYLHPHPRNADDADYVDRIAGLALHLAKF